MEETKEKFSTWVKEHKKQLIFAGVSMVALTGLILGLKNKNEINELWEILAKKIVKGSKEEFLKELEVTDLSTGCESITVSRGYTLPQNVVNIPEHIRTLPEHWHHSEAKAAEAARRGIDLRPNQTFVDPYKKKYT